jgi:hypothetical protein
MSRYLLPLLALAALQGCATQKIDLEVPPVGEDLAHGNGLAKLVVYRRADGHTSPYGVSINGEQVGQLSVREYVHALVPPGLANVVATAEVNSQAVFPVEANRAYYLLAKPMPGVATPRVQLTVVAPAKAKPVLAKYEDKTDPN